MSKIDSSEVAASELSLGCRSYVRYLTGVALLNNPRRFVKAAPETIFRRHLTIKSHFQTILEEGAYMALTGLRDVIVAANGPSEKPGFSHMRDKQPQVMPFLDTVAAHGFDAFEAQFGDLAWPVALWTPKPLESRTIYRHVCSDMGALTLADLVQQVPIHSGFGEDAGLQTIPKWSLNQIRTYHKQAAS